VAINPLTGPVEIAELNIHEAEGLSGEFGAREGLGTHGLLAYSR
jgi:hypothetical protein